MKESKKIIIAFDTGFSGGKITINKLVLHVPFVIIQQNEIQDGDYSLRRADKSYIECCCDNEKYFVGQAAEDYLLRSKKSEKADDMVQGLYTMSRFDTKEYSVMLRALIAYALVKYEKYSKSTQKVPTFSLDEIGEWDIRVGVSLPHSYTDEYKYKIREYLIGTDKQNPVRHNLTLTVGTDPAKNICYTINPTIVCNSQLKNAIINELLDENGYDVNSICDKANRPTLVIDGGYKTAGIGLVERDMSVANAKSNTEFAMLNINKKVCDRISMHCEGYQDYMIDELAENNEVIRYIEKDETVGELDVSAIKEVETAAAADKLIAYLENEFDNLLRIKSILIAGGTGKAYLPYLQEYCKKSRPFLADKIYVGTQNPENKFHGVIENGDTYTETVIDNPIYTVVLGLYKEMCAKLDK